MVCSAYRAVLLALIASLLSSCGYFVRESGFVESDWPKNSYHTPRAIDIWNNPRIEIESSCDGTNYTATFGPYIAIPLFIIPNPLWPFTYLYHTNKDATITLTITATSDPVDWNSISTKLVLNNKPLAIDHADDVSGSGVQQRRYVFRSGLTCKYLDDSELVVDTNGSQQMEISATVLYKHRWRASFDGI